jgi:hypothetical protein
VLVTPRGVARWLELALSVLLLAMLVGARDLPLVDLPQHALQLANWRRIDAGAAPDLELSFRTPYLLAYPILRALCEVTSELMALKLVFWGALVLQAVTLRRLCVRLGHDPRLGLLGFPLAMGYSFCFGFVAFCAALPLVYWGFQLVVEHREQPTPVSGAKLAAALALLLVAHGVALGFFVLVCSPLLVAGGGTAWRRLWPLSAPPLLAAVWLVPRHDSTRLGGDVWEGSFTRFVELPGQLVGIGSADPFSTLLGALLLGLVIAQLGPLRRPLLSVPLAVCLLGYGAFPLLFRGAGPLHPRFSSFLVPSLLLAFAPRTARSARAKALGEWGPLGIAVAVLLLFWSRLPAFSRETRGFHEVTAELPPGLSLRPLVFDRVSRAFPGIPAHLHVPTYYAVEKGGSAGYSFAMYSISVVRLRPGAPIRMGGGAEWAPERFDVTREGADYDYFVVKSAADRSSRLFPGPEPAAVLERRVGEWWLYRRAVSGRT